MTIDPYASCPGGTGKKIKFCCPDLVGDLEKIQKMLDAEQRVACLELIEKLETKFKDRACLLSIKAMLQAQLGDQAKAQETLGGFIKKYPGNPVALAEAALVAASNQGGREAIEPLQRALETCGQQMPVQLYEAIGGIAQALLAEGQVLAARGHLLLQLGISKAEDQQPMELMVRLNQAPSLPLLFKQDPRLVPAPEDVAWKASFQAAMELAQRGAWSAASEKLYELAGKVGDWPAIWRNIATLRIWLADTLGAVRALRKFAAQNVPLDDAVEAEALAQILDVESMDRVDSLVIPYPVTDMEKLLSALAASPRAVRMPIDMAEFGAEDEPPPKVAYWLLDRATPATGVGIARDQIPVVVGQVFVFGKQTDREARLELLTYRTADLAQSQVALGEVSAGALGEAGPEEVVSHVPAQQHAMSWNWRLPDDTPPEDRRSLISGEYRAVLLAKWPKLPLKIFGAKSAEAVAADPAFRVKLLAAILLLELGSNSLAAQDDHDALRQQLGLPTVQPIDAAVSIDELPLIRLSRLEPSQLVDDRLTRAYERASHSRHVVALRRFAREVVGRPSLEKTVDKAHAYGQLAEIEPDTKQALTYIDLARQSAEAAGKSSAPWDISELALRIAMDDAADADRLLRHIREQHMREPGVAQALFQVLSDAGIIGPDGRPTAGPAAASEPSGIVVPAAAATEPGKIWTPGGETQTAGKKPVIWTPG